jgi:hypothetical protein
MERPGPHAISAAGSSSSEQWARSARAILTAVVLLALAGSVGCATYSDRLESARRSVSAGDYAAGIGELDKVIGVDDPSQLPDSFPSDSALAVLERATLKQATEQWGSSARDFQTADKQLELLDITNDTVGDIGRYVFSDSATKYRTSPVEKLSLNAFNMLNYLVRGDLAGARVEARRFTVMRRYLEDADAGRAHVAFGSYLAGFTMERLGEYGSAMRYYDEALQERRFESLRAPVARLAQLTSYRGQRIGSLLAGAGPAPAVDDDRPELLVIVSTGRVPHKVPERMPIGAAIGIAGTYISGDPAVLGYTAMKFVVYPELVPSESVIRGVDVRLDGRSAPLELATHVGGEIRREYEALKPRIIGAALSRMIVRAAAAEGMRQAGREDSEGLGWVLALLTEGLLVAADKPDTRSWIFLPDEVRVHRSRVAPGRHEIRVGLGNAGDRTATVDLAPGGFAVVVVTAPR